MRRLLDKSILFSSAPPQDLKDQQLSRDSPLQQSGSLAINGTIGIISTSVPRAVTSNENRNNNSNNVIGITEQKLNEIDLFFSYVLRIDQLVSMLGTDEDSIQIRRALKRDLDEALALSRNLTLYLAQVQQQLVNLDHLDSAAQKLFKKHKKNFMVMNDHLHELHATSNAIQRQNPMIFSSADVPKEDWRAQAAAPSPVSATQDIVACLAAQHNNNNNKSKAQGHSMDPEQKKELKEVAGFAAGTATAIGIGAAVGMVAGPVGAIAGAGIAGVVAVGVGVGVATTKYIRGKNGKKPFTPYEPSDAMKLENGQHVHGKIGFSGQTFYIDVKNPENLRLILECSCNYEDTVIKAWNNQTQQMVYAATTPESKKRWIIRLDHDFDDERDQQQDDYNNNNNNKSQRQNAADNSPVVSSAEVRQQQQRGGGGGGAQASSKDQQQQHQPAANGQLTAGRWYFKVKSKGVEIMTTTYFDLKIMVENKLTSMLSTNDHLRTDVIMENERRSVVNGKYSASYLFYTDFRGNWSDTLGTPIPQGKDGIQLPDDSWVWTSDWEIVKNAETDDEGWQYASNWHREWHKNHSFSSFVRRRKWIRSRRQALTPNQIEALKTKTTTAANSPSGSDNSS